MPFGSVAIVNTLSIVNVALSLMTDPSLLERIVDLLSALSVVHPGLLEQAVPRLVEWFNQLLRSPSPSGTQLTTCISLALVDITKACLCWSEYQKLLSEGLLRQLVAVCVMSRDVIEPVLDNIATILSLYTQQADDR